MSKIDLLDLPSDKYDFASKKFDFQILPLQFWQKRNTVFSSRVLNLVKQSSFSIGLENFSMALLNLSLLSRVKILLDIAAQSRK